MKKNHLWLLWIGITLVLSGYYLYVILADQNKEELLIGEASHGHFQIEMACDTCHTDAFGGKESIQEACVGCHAQELEQAHDSHPKKKFTDPRNADLLKVLDARFCISCHTEHQKEQTRPMGVTIPDDYCYYCHQKTLEERESHKGLPFDSCGSAGCHNFHDNRAIYEDFLVENSGGEWLKDIARIAEQTAMAESAQPTEAYQSLPFIEQAEAHPEVHGDWLQSSHARANVSCGGCHSDPTQQWIQKPGVAQCASCHTLESETFLAGKHGMRLAAKLDPMDPGLSDLKFSDAAVAHQGCNQCHKPHSFKAKDPSGPVCLDCHNDTHSLAFAESPHGKLKLKADKGAIAADEVVTCATCHLPRVKQEGSGTIFVNHNQNDNLRPNEKMIRPVCMQCHSLDFSIDALADPALIENNFSGAPAKHIPSIDWALIREEE